MGRNCGKGVQEKEAAQENSGELGGKPKSFYLAGEILILCWVLGIFYFFYRRQGYFELVEEIFSGIF